jgi:hypothetical protein
MSNHCFKHIFEEAVDACRTCGNEFCESCLVFARGPQKPPYCVPCALVASGVRHSGRTLVRR